MSTKSFIYEVTKKYEDKQNSERSKYGISLDVGNWSELNNDDTKIVWYSPLQES